MHTSPAPAYRTLDQIEQLVRAFETCTVAPAEFTHHAHITVALWYLIHAPAEEATERMRAGLHRLLVHYGLHGYNETITLFWMKLLRHFLDVAGSNRSPVELSNEAIARFGSMRFVFHHFSKPLVFSDAARHSWVEPDLVPLAF